ncbi:MAG: ArsR/SmtB family transcription factor [Nanobdellota archaeon]
MAQEEQSDSAITIVELKDVANIAKRLSSLTASKILQSLQENSLLSASEISTKTGLALTTINYHLKSLVKAGVVDDSSFTYSAKGRTVVKYGLVDKPIIILPKKTPTSMSKATTFTKTIIGSIGAIGAGLSVWGASLLSTVNKTVKTTTETQPATYTLSRGSAETISQAGSLQDGVVILSVGVVLVLIMMAWFFYYYMKKTA